MFNRRAFNLGIRNGSWRRYVRGPSDTILSGFFCCFLGRSWTPFQFPTCSSNSILVPIVYLLSKARFRFRDPLEFSWETKRVDEIRGSLKGEFLCIASNGTLGSPLEFTCGQGSAKLGPKHKYSRKMAFKKR
jgi:hypothetical protein